MPKAKRARADDDDDDAARRAAYREVNVGGVMYPYLVTELTALPPCLLRAALVDNVAATPLDGDGWPFIAADGDAFGAVFTALREGGGAVLVASDAERVTAERAIERFLGTNVYVVETALEHAIRARAGFVELAASIESAVDGFARMLERSRGREFKTIKRRGADVVVEKPFVRTQADTHFELRFAAENSRAVLAVCVPALELEPSDTAPYTTTAYGYLLDGVRSGTARAALGRVLGRALRGSVLVVQRADARSADFIVPDDEDVDDVTVVGVQTYLRIEWRTGAHLFERLAAARAMQLAAEAAAAAAREPSPPPPPPSSSSSPGLPPPPPPPTTHVLQ